MSLDISPELIHTLCDIVIQIMVDAGLPVFIIVFFLLKIIEELIRIYLRRERKHDRN